MLVATRTFMAIVDGREETITAGRDFAEPSCDVVRDYPDCWAPATGRAVGSSRAVERSAQPRRQLTAEQEQQLIREQGRIRRARLDELAARERERPAPATPEDRFWQGVNSLLESVYPDIRRRREEDAAGMALIDELEAGGTRELRAEQESLASWVDR